MRRPVPWASAAGGSAGAGWPDSGRQSSAPATSTASTSMKTAVRRRADAPGSRRSSCLHLGTGAALDLQAGRGLQEQRRRGRQFRQAAAPDPVGRELQHRGGTAPAAQACPGWPRGGRSLANPPAPGRHRRTAPRCPPTQRRPWPRSIQVSSRWPWRCSSPRNAGSSRCMQRSDSSGWWTASRAMRNARVGAGRDFPGSGCLKTVSIHLESG